MQPSKHEHTHWTCFYYVRKKFALRFACCSIFCRCFAGVLQVFFAVSRPTILKPQSQCTLPARTGGHQGHSTPPVQASTQHPCTQHPAHSTQHPSRTRPLAQQWKLKAHNWSEGGSCPLRGWDSRCPYTPKGTFVLWWGKPLP